MNSFITKNEIIFTEDELEKLNVTATGYNEIFDGQFGAGFWKDEPAARARRWVLDEGKDEYIKPAR